MTETPAKSKLRGFNPHGTARAESLAGVPLASFRSRATAFAIDMLCVLAIYVPLAHDMRGLRDENKQLIIAFDFHDKWGFIAAIAYFGLCTYLFQGRTLGKRIMGIRVLSLVHERITLWQAVERTLGYGASTLEGCFGFLQYFIHKNRCCVHDRIAETIVIKERMPRKKQPEAAEDAAKLEGVTGTEVTEADHLTPC